MSEFNYPPGYMPMTYDDHRAIFNARETFPDIELGLIYERAILARLPKPDTAERKALVARIDDVERWDSIMLDNLLRDLRAHLVRGGE